MEGSHPYTGEMDRNEVRCHHLTFLGLPGGFFLPEIRGLSALAPASSSAAVSGPVSILFFRLLIDVLELKLELVSNNVRSGARG